MSFRFRYIVLPTFFLLLTIGLVIFFYPRLPGEVAYHFIEGQPDRWTGRGVATAWLLVPQFLLAGLGVAIVMGVIRLVVRFGTSPGKRSETLLWLMGNMVALPQLVLAFAMLSIFSYNSYGLYLMPLWLFAVIVMGLGGLVLGALFFLAKQQALARKS